MGKKEKPPSAVPSLKMITVKVPTALHTAAKVESAKSGVSLSFVVRRALEEWLEKSDAAGA